MLFIEKMAIPLCSATESTFSSKDRKLVVAALAKRRDLNVGFAETLQRHRALVGHRISHTTEVDLDADFFGDGNEAPSVEQLRRSLLLFDFPG